MNGSLEPLKDLALRELWTESEAQRARRRCRTLVASPFAALGGLTWGVFAAPVIGVGSGLFWGALGAFAFPFLMYVEQRLMPALRELMHRSGWGGSGLAALAGEAVLVGGVIFLLTSVLGAPIVPAVGTALGIGAFYAFVMEYVLCGSAARDVVGLIRGSGTQVAARPESFSHAEALTAQGRYEEAVAIYESAVERRPRNGSLYVRLAKAQVAQGEHRAAVDTLRIAYRRADLGPDQQAFVVRQIYEICVVRLHAPEEAIDDLSDFLKHHPDGVHADWARRAMDEL